MEKVHRSAVRRLLKLHFINVGDGDAILVEHLERGEVWRMLVDVGRPGVMDTPGSPRLSVANYFRSLKIFHLDALVVTHLHIDHFGGLRELLPAVTIDHVYSGYFPNTAGQRIPPRTNGSKTEQGLVLCLNQWAEDVERLRGLGCQLHEVETDGRLPAPKGLDIWLLCPSGEVGVFQKQVWDELFCEGLSALPEDTVYRSAKYRNPNSLRLRLRYAGRRVELAGDCYGEVWETEPLDPCDILKVPHHGDCKALTEMLAGKLRPAYGVISCGKDYIAHKDRPSYETARLLRQQGTQVWMTDAFSASWHVPNHWRSVDFTVWEDGTILTPDGRCSGRR